MKRFKRILTIAIPLLLLNLRAYAIDEVLGKGNEYAKYGAIIIAAAILALIIYGTYKADKKSELKEELAKEKEKSSFEVVAPEEDAVDIFANESSEYLEKNIVEESEEDSVYTTANQYIDNEEENEEESLYNNVNEYMDSKDELYNIMDESINEDNSNSKIDIFEEQQDIGNSITEEVDKEETIEDYSMIENTPEVEEIDAFTFDTAPVINNDKQEDKKISTKDDENIETVVAEEEIKKEEQETKSAKKYTGKKLNRTNASIMEDIEIENEDFDDEDDEDIGVPTFDDLLKKSEEEEPSEIEPFDFMAQMEENLKKDQEKRLEKKQSTKKETTKKPSTKRQSTKKKKEE